MGDIIEKLHDGGLDGEPRQVYLQAVLGGIARALTPRADWAARLRRGDAVHAVYPGPARRRFAATIAAPPRRQPLLGAEANLSTAEYMLDWADGDQQHRLRVRLGLPLFSRIVKHTAPHAVRNCSAHRACAAQPAYDLHPPHPSVRERAAWLEVFEQRYAGLLREGDHGLRSRSLGGMLHPSAPELLAIREHPSVAARIAAVAEEFEMSHGDETRSLYVVDFLDRAMGDRLASIADAALFCYLAACPAPHCDAGGPQLPERWHVFH